METHEIIGAFLVILGYWFISVAYWIALGAVVDNYFGE